MNVPTISTADLIALDAQGRFKVKFRVGKSRNHPEGVAIHVWHGDDTKYLTVYGASEQEAGMRADRVVRLLNSAQSLWNGGPV